MSEQAPNSHDTAVQAIEKMFGGGEDTAEEQAPEQEVEETQGEETPAEVEAAEGEGEEQAETPAAPEEVEVEIDGETYLVPKKISDRFIQHADYTRKTQDIAELRRSLSAEREAAAVEKAFANAVDAERKQLDQINGQLEQLKNVNLDEYTDATQLMKLAQYREKLRDAKADAEKSISDKRSQFDTKLKELSAQAIEAGQKYVEQRVKGFDDNAKRELFAYGLNEGYTRDELDRLTDPRITVTLWKAAQWDALQASKPAITKRTAQSAPVVKPGATKPMVSRVQALDKRFKEAKGGDAKRRSLEDLMTAKFGG